MALGPQPRSCFLALFSLPSSLLSSLLSRCFLVAFCVSGVIWSVPFGLNVTRSAHRWRRHRWLLVLCSFRALFPPLPPLLVSLALIALAICLGIIYNNIQLITIYSSSNNKSQHLQWHCLGAIYLAVCPRTICKSSSGSSQIRSVSNQSRIESIQGSISLESNLFRNKGVDTDPR